MKYPSLYRILSYILLPVGGLLAFNTIQGLLVSLANPLLLIITFVMACVPLYIFTSTYFFFNGVMKAKPCKPSLKEWIKANAVVSIIFTALMFLCSLMALAVLGNPQLLMETIKQMPAYQQDATKMAPAEIIKLFKLFVAIMLPLSIILIVHIIMTFNMLKQYKHVFDEK